MMAICLAAAAFSAVLPLQQFTLAWNHSIEKIRWEEDYIVVDGRLRLTEARIRGSGAGMEPPEGAILRNGAWHYSPRLPDLPRISLRRSGFVADYEWCTDGECKSLSAIAGPPDKNQVLDIFPCTSP
ncbi:hypothetical protein ASE07_10805 [Noviherbaspirillum sp. Root189]|nr:hypothetical protein ASE07_10805 [Noviherbaspirillum sp. Root189]